MQKSTSSSDNENLCEIVIRTLKARTSYSAEIIEDLRHILLEILNSQPKSMLSDPPQIQRQLPRVNPNTTKRILMVIVIVTLFLMLECFRSVSEGWTTKDRILDMLMCACIGTLFGQVASWMV